MKRFTSFQQISFLALLLCFTQACTSVETLVERGNYEESIELAQRKLTGKQKKNPKYVAALERAVNEANERDVARAKFMREGGNADWSRIYSIYDNIKQRQDALRPLLPLVDKNGRQANFKFVRVEEMITDAGSEAADQIYNDAVKLLEEGRQGNKASAREAYAQFERIERYRSNYRDSYALTAEAEQLGRVYVAVEVTNESGGYLPAGFEAELLRVRTSEMDDRWRQFDFQRRDDRSYDYRATIVIRNIEVSPERVTERSFIEEKEITDGTEYVLDGNGNVAKDTLGNDITRPKRVVVRANVVEVLQSKSAIVDGSLQLFDLRRQRTVDEESLTAEAIFENYASTFQGDRRALTTDTRRRIGNRPAEFPSDEQLILDAANSLKPQLQQRLAESYRLI